MENRLRVDVSGLLLPDELVVWIGDSAVFESSGHSGAQTFYIDKGVGAYLKIAGAGDLGRAAQMQGYFADKGLAPLVLWYLSWKQDYLVTKALKGKNGTWEGYFAQPERLCEVFAEVLRKLHAVEVVACPGEDKMVELLASARDAAFRQSHLDDLANYIGGASASQTAAEIVRASDVLVSDVLIHGDYCLPNIVMDDWVLQGLINVADGGIGDRHYDLAWGLWTLNHNLGTPKYGQRFLDAYGRELVDRERLRVCGLLTAME